MSTCFFPNVKLNQRYFLKKAACLIKKGKIVAFPTETVYGLGVDPYNEKAMHDLYDLKKRSKMKFFTLHVSSLEKVKEITIGAGNKTATVGGRDCYPFHLFEGNMPNKPIIAMEIWDMSQGDGQKLPLSHLRMSFLTHQHGPRSVSMNMARR